MVKKYILLTNEKREELCRLIHSEGMTIKEASEKLAFLTLMPRLSIKHSKKNEELTKDTQRYTLNFNVLYFSHHEVGR
jgi:hypothetical protein